MDEVTLKRSLSLPLVVLYGLGTIVGAGVYALMGEVVASAGILAPLSFLLASVLAGFSAVSMAELSSRYPKSAGEAVYVLQGFGSKPLSTLVGLFVILSGLVSAAAILNGFVGYLQDLMEVDRGVAIIGIGALLGAIAIIGIGASVRVAALITLIEVGGLGLIIWSGFDNLSLLPAQFEAAAPRLDGATIGGIMAGSVLAFYAFIGFEDMVNVAEEVKKPRRNLPRAILITMVLTSIIYVLVALVAITSVPLEDLVGHGAPLALVFEATRGGDGEWISSIAILAMLNGALIQIIMAARVFYGLARQGSLPAFLGRVHAKTQTPAIATMLATAAIIVMAMVGSLGGLAKATSFIILIVFTLVNLALLNIKKRAPKADGSTTFPRWVPLMGAVTSAGFALWQGMAFLTS